MGFDYIRNGIDEGIEMKRTEARTNGVSIKIRKRLDLKMLRHIRRIIRVGMDHLPTLADRVSCRLAEGVLYELGGVLFYKGVAKLNDHFQRRC